MSRAIATSAAARGIAAGAVVCAAAATLLIAGGAALVVLAGAGDDVRRALRFDFAGVERTPSEAVRIALHNARLAAATLICAVAAPQLARRARPLVDVVLVTVLAVNAGLVGLALGAYGVRLAAATAVHLPVEFIALSIAGGGYVSARRQPLNVRTLAWLCGLCGVLLAVAAITEAYVSSEAQR